MDSFYNGIDIIRKEIAEQKSMYEAVQEAKQTNDFVPFNIEEIFGKER
jgi:hypothetical protein